MKLLIALGVVFGIAASSAMWLMGSYNGLVAGSQSVDTAWATVETQYQRRFDLIPNLVGAVKGAMRQEEKVFGAIAEARTRYASAKPNSDEKVAATGEMEGALARLLVVMENYPELKSLEHVTTITDELAGTENRIAVARDRYNAVVGSWNVKVKSFPGSLIAGMFDFRERELFKSDAEAAKAPVVNLE